MSRFLAILFLVALAVGAFSCGTSTGPCKDDYDCDWTLVCNVAAGRCEKANCRQDSDCLDPRLACRDNQCVAK